ncbi:toll/interleukin-1 receptor domain-containing protein [Acinetobacter baumannii]|jgi:hypothetical protein|nr:toll/interleukin-1 receptor domain-containing protein [Acinetobacter baumannii]
MPVFISYRHKDRGVALAVAQRLYSNNIKYYLDVVDEESLNTQDITEVITRNIQRCTHLMAIISPNTQGSWWVPFEIGEATVIDRRICSYAYNTDSYSLTKTNLYLYKNFLPEYLRKWPVLINDQDLNNFISEYKRDTRVGALFDSVGNPSFRNLTKTGADQFHRNLKAVL